jgi:hypothetical protein
MIHVIITQKTSMHALIISLKSKLYIYTTHTNNKKGEDRSACSESKLTTKKKKTGVHPFNLFLSQSRLTMINQQFPLAGSKFT